MTFGGETTPVWARVSESVRCVGSWQLARLALLGRVVVDSVELDLVPLLKQQDRIHSGEYAYSTVITEALIQHADLPPQRSCSATESGV